MSESIKVSVEQWQNFQFLVDFQQGTVADLVTDEPPPLGQGVGPNPARLLAAAVANCLAASLLFCLKKSHIEPVGIRAVIEGDLIRNERGRIRIKEFRVRIEPMLENGDVDRITRCAALFEDFCMVTESVREGIDVLVELAPISVTPASV
jgi:organic hydroperoxide reductase OsmC/OhrA